MTKLKLGLIGYGYWGPNYARIIAESEDCELKYCADIDAECLSKVKNKYPTVITTKDYRDILKDKEVRAIILATPTKTHYKIAKECILSKKHTLIEKPLCYRVEEGEELIRIATDNKVILMVGHVFLFNPAVRYLKQAIDKGQLGQLRHLHFQRRSLGPIRQDINVVWDLAPHDVSMALFFTGLLPLSVIASGQSFLQKNIYDVVSVSIKFPHDIIANLILSWIDPVKIRDVAVVGDKKMILFDDVQQSEKIRIFNKNVNIIRDTHDVSFGEYQIALHSGDILIPAITNKEPLKEEFSQFRECITDNKRPLTDGENGLEVVRVISAIQESLENNSQLIRI